MSDINIIDPNKKDVLLLNQLAQVNREITKWQKTKTLLEFKLHEGKIPLDLFKITKGWSRVVYAFPKNGWDSGQSTARALTLGKVYPVCDISIGGSSSEIQTYSDKLNKMVWINSVAFCEYHPELAKQFNIDYTQE